MRTVLAVIAIALFPLALSAQTVDTVIAKYIAARGGLAQIKALQSERLSGTISFGPGETAPTWWNGNVP